MDGMCILFVCILFVTVNVWLTLSFLVPRAWLIRPVESIYDLDNLKLSNVKADHVRKGVEATFKLVHILVEGHVRENLGNSPPRGAQFILGTPTVPHMVDTITMTNLGYIQLKANPGVWELRLREGRSADIYEIDHVGDSYSAKKAEKGDTGLASIIVNNFRGVTVYPVVKRRPGKEQEDVLEPEEGSKGGNGGGIWEQLKSRYVENLFIGNSFD
jgi:UDP-glucose:glycoprotein glucosyltransferase